MKKILFCGYIVLNLYLYDLICKELCLHYNAINKLARLHEGKL